ncbi:hypothetical protein HETIRDRAFT_315798 [Heterobasidion irregulare TC 32-1]|uniref:Fungal-type protein kinase domain-containing protein n=1 Tax=Heterobasidion irregulare (strain TC 32-1) TaxID=747525 RepID=W4KCG8_HETIT|nr:uncharacterized protein HETIRDRAFT_315798 [Heterobasidion irregulare TC 32-1]ETW83429.1 hypothetical protein HETIRDRAFT_315798 [Heterobasidion irregulare TC 32-1]
MSRCRTPKQSKTDLSCTSKPEEKSRYRLFVDLSNDVLKKLRTIDIADIRRANEDLNITLYQNNRDPQVSRGPRVVLVSLAAAELVAPDRGDMQWDDIVAEYACEGPSPRKNLAWSSICASIEFEVCAYILNPPPATYSGLGQVIPAKVNYLEPTTSHSLITIHSSRRPTPTIRTADATFKQTKIVAKRPETLSLPIIQSALYGVEILSRKPCINHAINLLFIDDVIWIWWYDRQGAIQTEGINFVQDLPRFLILLFAFQRFGLEGWGFNISLDTEFDAIYPSDVASRGIAADQTRYIKTSILRASGEWEDIDIDTIRQVHQAYGLVGRGTSVFCGTAARLRKVESSRKRHMAGGVTTAFKPSTELRKVTAKIHWQEEPLLNEAEGLRGAYTLRSNTDTLGHHPEPLYARDYTQYSTGNIRRKLGLDPPEKRRPARFLRLAVFLRPRPITTVVGEAFLKAWLDCVRSHYSLWELGIQDVTPRLSNLMVDMDKRGFLIDWKLATIL